MSLVRAGLLVDRQGCGVTGWAMGAGGSHLFLKNNHPQHYDHRILFSDCGIPESTWIVLPAEAGYG